MDCSLNALQYIDKLWATIGNGVATDLKNLDIDTECRCVFIYIYRSLGCAKGEEFDQGLLGLISGGFYGCGLGLWARGSAGGLKH